MHKTAILLALAPALAAGFAPSLAPGSFQCALLVPLTHTDTVHLELHRSGRRISSFFGERVSQARECALGIHGHPTLHWTVDTLEPQNDTLARRHWRIGDPLCGEYLYRARRSRIEPKKSSPDLCMDLARIARHSPCSYCVNSCAYIEPLCSSVSFSLRIPHVKRRCNPPECRRVEESGCGFPPQPAPCSGVPADGKGHLFPHGNHSLLWINLLPLAPIRHIHDALKSSLDCTTGESALTRASCIHLCPSAPSPPSPFCPRVVLARLMAQTSALVS
jgi:hypothetical protein